MNGDAAPPRAPRAPRVPGHPILGCLPEFRRDALAYYRGCHARFGDAFEVRFVNQPVVTIAHPDGIQRVLQTNHMNYQRAPFINDLFIRLTGMNLFTLDGPSWLAERRLVQPAFHRARIQAFGTTMVEAAEHLLRDWRAAARAAGGTAHVDMLAEMRKVTMAVVGPSLFSVDFSGHASELGAAMLATTDFFEYRSRRFLAAPEAFRPERFLDGAGPSHPFAYAPFGGGPRKCIGEQFALTEAQLILATLVPRTDATPLGTKAVEADSGFTLQVAEGLAMGVRVREGA